MSGEVVVREWRMDALHDLYALGDPNEIIGRVDAMNEHNACVTALRAALADAAKMRELLDSTVHVVADDEVAELRADAARLREALRARVVLTSRAGSECLECRTWSSAAAGERHVDGCLAALGQEERK